MARTKRAFTFCTLEKSDVLRGLPKDKENQTFKSSRASRRVRRLHRKEPKHLRREPEASYPFSSSSKGLRRPAFRRRNENEKIDSPSTGHPRPRDHGTNTNPKPTDRASATKAGSSGELASELPQGRSETKASAEHPTKILAGWLRGSVLENPNPARTRPATPLRPTLPPASTNAVQPRLRIRGSVSGQNPVRFAEDFSANGSLRRVLFTLTSSRFSTLYLSKHQYNY